MKNLISLILFLFVLTSCQKLRRDEALVHQIIDVHEKNQLRKYKLDLIGAGSAIPDQVKGFILHYVAREPLTIDEARYIFVTGVEDLLSLINSNDELRPYMAEYPFTHSNLKYMISFWDCNSKNYESPSVALVFLCKGNICYCFYDNANQKFNDDLDYIEPYSTSYQIVYGRSRVED